MKINESIKNYFDIEDYRKNIKLNFKTLFSATNSDKTNSLYEFIQFIALKKQQIKKLKNKISILNRIKCKDHKALNDVLPLKKNLSAQNNFSIMYVFNIIFSKTNTLLHVTDCSGKLKFFCSAGAVKYTGKGKKARYHIVGEFRKLLITKFKFMRLKPIALHLKNVTTNDEWLIRKLKKKFYIKIIRIFDSHPYNGCRNQKKKRKKIKKKF